MWIRAVIGCALLTCALACAAAVDRGEEEDLVRVLPPDARWAEAAGHQAPRDEAAQLGRPSTGKTHLPCEVQRVLASSCQGCHGAVPGQVAPMALVTHEDLLAPAVSDPSLPVYALIARRVHDTVAPMPPASHRPLSSQELAVLDAFVAGGAPSGTDACETQAPTEHAIDYTAPDPEEIGACYRLTAHEHEIPGDTSPYLVQHGEHYACFFFAIPWPQGSHALTLRSLAGPHTHHWELFHTVAPHTDGEVRRDQESCGFEARAILGIWGINQQPEQHMPRGVGLALPAPEDGHGLMLELHYFNHGVTAEDRSGVEVCTAKRRRAQTASISALGTALFSLPPGRPTHIQATCTPRHPGEIYVFRSFPHMHARGRSMQAAIVRADGRREPLFDIPFDFNDQRTYDVPAVLRPGDRLLTRCHFVNDTDRVIVNGFGAEDEMCIHFVYAWPAGALTDGFFPGACVF